MLAETPDMQLMDGEDARNLRDGLEIKIMQNRFALPSRGRASHLRGQVHSGRFQAISDRIVALATISSAYPRH